MNLSTYCAFHKHANSKNQNPPSQLRFSLPSIIITITSNKPWSTETHKTHRNPPITNHKAWPFDPVKVKFCFLRAPLRWLTAVKDAIVSWLLNFRIRMFVKSAVESQFRILLNSNTYKPTQRHQDIIISTRSLFRKIIQFFYSHYLLYT